MTLEKSGPHCQLVTEKGLVWSRRAALVKALDNPQPLREAPAGAIKIFRRYFAQQDINRPGSQIVDNVLAALGNAPCTYIELFNEIAQRLGQGLERHVAMTQEAVTHLNSIRPDLRILGFSFSTGSPELSDWEYLRSKGFGGVQAVGWHGYWGLPYNAQNPRLAFTPYNAFRYRLFWKPGDPLILASECGRDKVRDGANGQYVGNGGWIADGLTDEQFLREIEAYDDECQKDAHMLGGTFFTNGPSSQWEKYSMDGLSDRLAALSTFPTGFDPEIPPVPSLPPVPPAPSPTPGGNMTEASFERLCADVFFKAGVPYNPASAFVKYWKKAWRDGNYLGQPEANEFPFENTPYLMQRFAGANLWARKSDFVVHEGLPPFS